MTEPAASPDERALRAHLATHRFRAGEIEGRWAVRSFAWPHALIAVAAAPRDGAPDEYLFRFELTKYPQEAPTAALWDESGNQLLPGERRPKGGGSIMPLFRNDWEDGRALYAPYDRIAIEAHGQPWADQYPMSKWTPARDLTFFLVKIYEELRSNEYSGI